MKSTAYWHYAILGMLDLDRWLNQGGRGRPLSGIEQREKDARLKAKRRKRKVRNAIARASRRRNRKGGRS